MIPHTRFRIDGPVHLCPNMPLRHRAKGRTTPVLREPAHRTTPRRQHTREFKPNPKFTCRRPPERHNTQKKPQCDQTKWIKQKQTEWDVAIYQIAASHLLLHFLLAYASRLHESAVNPPVPTRPPATADKSSPHAAPPTAAPGSPGSRATAAWTGYRC